MEVTIWHLQAASIASMIGIALGWRGGMRRIWGFVDSQTSWRSLAIGIGVGAVLALAADLLVVRPAAQIAADAGAFAIDVVFLFALLVGALASVLTYLILTRPSIRRAGSAPAAGWLLGLGLGAMTATWVGVRALEVQGWLWGGATLAGIAFCAPWSEAIISCWQGTWSMTGRRWLPMAGATGLRALLTTTVVTSALWQPWVLLLIPPLLLWGQSIADQHWLPKALLPRMAQRFRRVVSQSVRRDALAEARRERWVRLSEE